MCQLWGFLNAPCFHPFCFLPTKMCVCVSPNSLRSLFVRMNFPPIFCCYRTNQMVKEAMIFQPPKKNTLTHLYATVEQKYLHPVYMVCRKCRPFDHAPRRWLEPWGTNPRQSRGFVAFVLFRGGHKDWCFEWLVFSGGRVGEVVETVVWSWLVGTKTLNYCKISVE